MGNLKNNEPKQLTLPLEVMKRDSRTEYAEIVKQNWKITFSKQHFSSVYAKRVMGLIASQIREDGEVKEYYQITADKIINETGLQNKEVYKRMKSVVYEMAHVVYFLEDDETMELIPRHLLDTTRFKYPAGYKSGILTIAFNPQLKGIINQMAHYANFELHEYINYSSWYSMRLHELLYAFRDKNEVEFFIDKYRDWMGCGVQLNEWTGKPIINKKTGKPKYIKFQSSKDVIKKTTKKPLEEFKNTDLEFKVFPVYAEAFGRGRPRIEKIRFEFVKQKRTVEETISHWLENFKDFRRMYERLKVYNVSDNVIVKYSRIIGKDKINKLLYEWDTRQYALSKDKIINTERYCNKVLKDVAEKIQNG